MAAIVSRHADDTAFLWLFRDYAVRAPHYTLDDLARLEARIEANLDGLEIARDVGWAACGEGMSHGEAGEVFAAACLALHTGYQPHVDAVLEVVAAFPLSSQGLIGALGWVSWEQAAPVVSLLLGSGVPVLQSVALAAAVAHQRNPGTATLRAALRSEASILRRRALLSIGRLGQIDLQPALELGLVDQDLECRFAAAWALSLLGSAKGLPILRTIAEDCGHQCEAAASLATRLVGATASRSWLRGLASVSSARRAAIVAAGAAGTPSAVPWLIEQMHILSTARVAGEALTLITGADLHLLHLEQPRPPDFIAGPTDDPADENVSMDPDEHLPWPVPRLVERWWGRNRSRFDNKRRYLLGEPINGASLQRAISKGRQRQRGAAALELKLRAPRKPLFDVRAPASRQRRMLLAI